MAGATLLAPALYAGWVEPSWIEVTRTSIRPSNCAHAVAVQLSDLHLREMGMRERRILEVVSQLAPDLMILPGDVIDRPEALPVLAQILGNWPAGTSCLSWETGGTGAILTYTTCSSSTKLRVSTCKSARPRLCRWVTSALASLVLTL